MEGVRVEDYRAARAGGVGGGSLKGAVERVRVQHGLYGIEWLKNNRLEIQPEHDTKVGRVSGPGNPDFVNKSGFKG